MTKPEHGGADTDHVWIVIPALNAAGQLPAVLDGCLERSFEGRIVVVDDGSTDDTSAVALRAGATVVRHSQNRGKGEALRTGFEIALREKAVAVITMDADGQHLPSESSRLLETWRATGADLVIGSRSHLFAGMKRRRRFANRFSSKTVSKFAGVPLNDTQSGFRLYAREFITGVDFDASGFAAESEMIVLGGRRGMRIVEVPIRLGYVDGVSTSHYRPILDSVRIAARVTAAAIRPILKRGRLA